MFTPLVDSLYPERLFVRFRGAQVAVRSDSVRFMQWVERQYRPLLERDRDPAASLDRFRLEPMEGGRHCLVDDETDQIVGVDSDDLGFLFWQLKDEIALRLMGRSRDLAWLHAGGAVAPASPSPPDAEASGGGPPALLVAGPAGGGKSTFSAAFGRAGWRYLGDDLLPLDLRAGRVWPFPLTAHVRRPAAEYVPEDRIGWLAKDHCDFPADRVAAAPAPIGALLLSEFRPGAEPAITPIPPSLAVVKLASFCQNFPDYDGDAIAGLCGLVERVSVAQLVHGGAHQAEGLVLEWATERLSAPRATAGAGTC